MTDEQGAATATHETLVATIEAALAGERAAVQIVVLVDLVARWMVRQPADKRAALSARASAAIRELVPLHQQRQELDRELDCQQREERP